MREILFKGKRVDNREWVEGSLVVDPDTKHYEIAGFEYYTDSDGHQREPFSCIVDPETVGQYTGLKDKHGNKIFEGDIISTDLDRPYMLVEYKNGCFVVECVDDGKTYYDLILRYDEQDNVYKFGEVIGNRWDNPQLLEG